jgi:hypothetical protein
MKGAVALAALMAIAGSVPLCGQSIDRYVETLNVEPDGSGHVVTGVELSAGPGTTLNLPVTIGRPSSVSVSGAPRATAVVESTGGHTWVTVDIPDARSKPISLEAAYDVEGVINDRQAPLAHGNRRLRYEFVNTTGLAIGVFESTVVLPPGVVISSVDVVTPAPAETTAGRPFTIEEREGRPAIVIRAVALGVGDRAGVTVGFKPRSSSVLLLVVLAIVSAAYLYGFRDLARSPRRDADV